MLLQSVHKLAAEAEEPISKSRQATAKALLNVADMLRNLDSETAWKSTLINISKVIDLEKGIRDAIQFFENTDWQVVLQVSFLLILSAPGHRGKNIL